MINKKLKAIASFINKHDTVIDIGCDHAYLAIYLKENKLCKNVYASDINQNALNIAKTNIQEHNLDIETILSDGFKSIHNPSIDTAVISGMGTNSILDIIRYAPQNINKYILCSHNNLDILRKKLYEHKLYIESEIAIYEHKKYYVIMLVTKNYQKENRISLKYGRSNNKEYLTYLLEKEQEVLKHIPKRKIKKRLKHLKNTWDLRKLIKRSEEH
ncbi:MAG TPA: SAM-dependent methyltransferase [Candidatus Caccenecus avistercoris]|nr:SAM-dependent methyltransferase [Candidatus Caccenecus avistercoris]